jgi:hypothetical protein
MIQVGFIDAIGLKKARVQVMFETAFKLMCKWQRVVMGMTKLL